MQSTSLPCPNCQQPFRLTSVYLQQYGGRVTSCPACQQQFTLPTVDEVFGAAEPQAPATQPAAHQAAVPPATRSYSGEGIWRDGWYAYVNRGASLPQCCFRCATTSDLSVIDFELSHVRGQAAGSLSSASDHYFRGETMLVRAFACPRHRSGVSIQRRVANGLLILGILLFIAGPILLVQNYVMAGIACLVIPTPLLFVAKLIMAASPTGLVATRIDQHGATVSGFGREFLLKIKPLAAAQREHRDAVSSALHATH